MLDAFLEISTHLFIPCSIYQVYVLGMIFQTCFSMFVCIICVREKTVHSLLREIREPVWSYIIEVCSSFSARDCNACFNQVFEKRTFGYLNEEEETLNI